MSVGKGGLHKVDLYLLPGHDDDLIEFYNQGRPGFREEALIYMIEQGRRGGALTLDSLNPPNKGQSAEVQEKALRVRLNLSPRQHPDLIVLWAGCRRGQRSNLFVTLATISLHAMKAGRGLMLSNMGSGGGVGTSAIEVIEMSGDVNGVDSTDQLFPNNKKPGGVAVIQGLLAGLDDDDD
jgi:hypothetical protein